MESKGNKEKNENAKTASLKEPVLTDIISRNTELLLSNVVSSETKKNKRKRKNKKSKEEIMEESENESDEEESDDEKEKQKAKYDIDEEINVKDEKLTDNQIFERFKIIEQKLREFKVLNYFLIKNNNLIFNNKKFLSMKLLLLTK